MMEIMSADYITVIEENLTWQLLVLFFIHFMYSVSFVARIYSPCLLSHLVVFAKADVFDISIHTICCHLHGNKNACMPNILHVFQLIALVFINSEFYTLCVCVCVCVRGTF